MIRIPTETLSQIYVALKHISLYKFKHKFFYIKKILKKQDKICVIFVR